MDSWSAHVFKLGRTPVVLFMHDASLWHVIIPAKGITKLENLLRIFLARVREVWGHHGAGFDNENQSVIFLPRGNRSLIGSMNEAIFQIRAFVETGFDLDDSQNLTEVEDLLQRTPYSALGYGFPDRKLQELLSKRD